MTPMNKLSNNINSFKELIKPYFKEINLNKSKSKYNPYPNDGEPSTTKGVSSDFITIFELISNKKISFAFAYNYIDVEESKQTVEVTMKNGFNNHITNAMPMLVNDFKNKLNQINKDMTNSDLSAKNILEKINKFFMDEKIDILKEVQVEEQKFQNFVTKRSLELEIPKYTNDTIEISEKTKTAFSLVEKELKESPLGLQIKKVQKELAELNQKYDSLKNQLKDKYNINQLKNQYIKNEYLLDNANKILKNDIDNYAEKIPKMISKKMKK